MRQVKMRLVPLLAAGLLLGSAAGPAQASGKTVTAAVKAQDRVVKSSAAYRSLNHIKANTPSQVRRLIAEFRALQHKVRHAATVVSRASANGTRQRRGRREWVTGARELARGIGQLGAGLHDALIGRTSAGNVLLKRAGRTVARANAVGTKGDRLLGLPASD